MGRTKGATNKITSVDLLYTSMTVDERLAFLANLIVVKIRDDQNNDNKLFKNINRYRNESTTASI